MALYSALNIFLPRVVSTRGTEFASLLVTRQKCEPPSSDFVNPNIYIMLFMFLISIVTHFLTSSITEIADINRECGMDIFLPADINSLCKLSFPEIKGVWYDTATP